MEVSNRFAAESELQKALAIVWAEWSKERDPSMLTKEYLEELLANECEGPLWAVWIAANTNVLMEYGQAQDESALVAIFMAFFNNWKKDVAERWGARVDQHVEETRSFAGGGGGGGGGSGPSVSSATVRGPTTSLPTVGEPISFQQAARNEITEIEEEEVVEPLPWREAKLEILANADFQREAVTVVTTTHTQGELTAVAKVQAGGPIMIPKWRAEPGACKVCQGLDGKRKNVWGAVAPNGPGKEPHPSCRCHLEWVAIEDT